MPATVQIFSLVYRFPCIPNFFVQRENWADQLNIHQKPAKTRKQAEIMKKNKKGCTRAGQRIK